MRSLLFLAVLPLPAFADTFAVSPKVASALVTGQGGVVTYAADLAIPEGRHQVTLRLPSTDALNGVTGIRLPDGLQLVAQTFAQSRAAPPLRVLSDRQQAARDARIAAERDLAAHERRKAGLEAQISAADLRVTLAQQTAQSGLSGENPPTAEELTAMATALAELVRDASDEIARLTPQLLTLEPETARLEKALIQAQAAEAALIADAVQPSGLLTLTVNADTPVNGPLEVDNVEFVFWNPSYSFDLTHDGAKGSLILQRKAVVSYADPYGGFQEPLYPWTNIDLTLTTANLSDRTVTDIPRPQLMRLIDQASRKRLGSTSYSVDRLEAELAEEPAVTVVDTQSVNYTGQSVEFSLGSGHSVDPYADQGTFDIDQVNLPVDLFAMANAAQDSHAYLYTELTNQSPGILLAGSGLLKVNGAIIGDIFLPTLLPGQAEPLGLGPLHGIRIDRTTLSVQEGEGGIITSRSEVERNFRTDVTSALGYSIDLRLLDVVPTSENEDLVITSRMRPNPDTERRDGKRGVLEWVLPMDPGQSRTVEFGYRMQWPGDKVPVPK